MRFFGLVQAWYKTFKSWLMGNYFVRTLATKVTSNCSKQRGQLNCLQALPFVSLLIVLGGCLLFIHVYTTHVTFDHLLVSSPWSCCVLR